MDIAKAASEVATLGHLQAVTGLNQGSLAEVLRSGLGLAVGVFGASPEKALASMVVVLCTARDEWVEIVRVSEGSLDMMGEGLALTAIQG